MGKAEGNKSKEVQALKREAVKVPHSINATVKTLEEFNKQKVDIALTDCRRRHLRQLNSY